MSLRVAAVQTPGAALHAWRDTLALLESRIADAAGRGAELVVLPECAFPAYVLGSAEAYWAARGAGLPAPDVTLLPLRDWARQLRVGLCIGHVAERGQTLLNAATLIDATDRICGTHHKAFLWDFDHDYFAAGEELRPIDTPWGRIGVMICADARLPEIAATLVTRGAELLLQPTAWVNVGTADAPWNPQPEFLIAARAEEFAVPVVSASKYGVEAGTGFVGGAVICDATGRIVARLADASASMVLADVTPAPGRRPVMTRGEHIRLVSTIPPFPPPANVARVQFSVDDDGRIVLTLPRQYLSTPLDSAGLSGGQLGGERRLRRTIGKACFIHGPAEEMHGFATARCAALGEPIPTVIDGLAGAHFIAVYGDGASEQLLRTRALENRVFVVQSAGGELRVWGPDGRRLTSQPPDVRLALAANKQVARGTDVLADRRPEMYEF